MDIFRIENSVADLDNQVDQRYDSLIIWVPLLNFDRFLCISFIYSTPNPLPFEVWNRSKYYKYALDQRS